MLFPAPISLPGWHSLSLWRSRSSSTLPKLFVRLCPSTRSEQDKRVEGRADDLVEEPGDDLTKNGLSGVRKGRTQWSRATEPLQFDASFLGDDDLILTGTDNFIPRPAWTESLAVHWRGRRIQLGQVTPQAGRIRCRERFLSVKSRCRAHFRSHDSSSRALHSIIFLSRTFWAWNSY